MKVIELWDIDNGDFIIEEEIFHIEVEDIYFLSDCLDEGY
jgi:hypothetical protein